jgi:hypothetical protein
MCAAYGDDDDDQPALHARKAGALEKGEGGVVPAVLHIWSRIMVAAEIQHGMDQCGEEGGWCQNHRPRYLRG